MKTAMQELRDDLVATLKTGDEALYEIKDKSIRESCQKVVQLTLESIIKRIDEELLEMEKEQMIEFASNCIHRNSCFFNIEEYYETFKQQEQ
jgi:hypothetical protein